LPTLIALSLVRQTGLLYLHREPRNVSIALRSATGREDRACLAQDPADEPVTRDAMDSESCYLRSGNANT
jgi:hypothetical protein